MTEACTEPPVHVVGLLGGRPVGDDARAALAAATLVAGGRDQLAAVADLLAPGARTETVGAGLGALDAVAAHAGPACVLASGDPGFHGITRALAARLGRERLVVHPAPSSVALAFARLGLPWDDAVVASCHAGGAARAAAQVAGASVAAVLCGPAAPPQAVGRGAGRARRPPRPRGGGHPAGRAGRGGGPARRRRRPGRRASSTTGRSSCWPTAPAPRRPSVAPAVRTGGRPVARLRPPAGDDHQARGALASCSAASTCPSGACCGTSARAAAASASRPRWPPPACGWWPSSGIPRRRPPSWPTPPPSVRWSRSSPAPRPSALAGLPSPDRVFVGGGGLDVLDACLARRPPGRAGRRHVRRRRPGPGGPSPARVAGPGVGRPGRRPARRRRALRGRQPGVRRLGRRGAGRRSRVRTARATASSSASAARRRPSADDVRAVVAERGGRRAGRRGRPAVVATIDRRADHPAVTAAAGGLPVVAFPASLLAAVDVPNPSATVDEAVGTPSVAEAAALLAAGPGARLVVEKRRGADGHRRGRRRARPAPATRAGPGRRPGARARPSTGPRRPSAPCGRPTPCVGYGPYVDAVAPLLRPDQLVLRSAMGAEAERAGQAVCPRRRRVDGRRRVVGRPRDVRHGLGHARGGGRGGRRRRGRPGRHRRVAPGPRPWAPAGRARTPRSPCPTC